MRPMSVRPRCGWGGATLRRPDTPWPSRVRDTLHQQAQLRRAATSDLRRAWPALSRYSPSCPPARVSAPLDGAYPGQSGSCSPCTVRPDRPSAGQYQARRRRLPRTWASDPGPGVFCGCTADRNRRPKRPENQKALHGPRRRPSPRRPGSAQGCHGRCARRPLFPPGHGACPVPARWPDRAGRADAMTIWRSTAPAWVGKTWPRAACWSHEHTGPLPDAASTSTWRTLRPVRVGGGPAYFVAGSDRARDAAGQIPPSWMPRPACTAPRSPTTDARGPGQRPLPTRYARCCRSRLHRRGDQPPPATRPGRGRGRPPAEP